MPAILWLSRGNPANLWDFFTSDSSKKKDYWTTEPCCTGTILGVQVSAEIFSYEIQLEPEVKGKGLGKFMMQVIQDRDEELLIPHW